MQFTVLLGLAVSLLSSTVWAIDTPTDPGMSADMKNSIDYLDQNKLITQKNGWVYNFTDNEHFSWQPGSVCNANAATFPSLTGLGVMVAQLNLGPCAMLAPHLHRATNLVVAINGTTHTYMVQENGAKMVETHLSQGMMTIFPAAAMHSMVNEGCEYNQLYSFLNSEDAGTLNAMNTIWQFGPEIGSRIMPMVNVAHSDWDTVGAQIPVVGTGSTSGYQSCLKKCGLA